MLTGEAFLKESELPGINLFSMRVAIKKLMLIFLCKYKGCNVYI